MRPLKPVACSQVNRVKVELTNLKQPMPVKIRLQRRGRKKSPFYHIVVADARAPRDGRFIEKVGTYNPMTKPATIELDREKAYEWLTKGAQPTDTVRAIFRFKGVMYKKHLMRGVAKGALTQEEAETMYQAWIDAKDTKLQERFTATLEEQKAFHQRLSGQAPPKVVPAVVVEAPAAPVEEAVAEVTEEAPAAEETPAEEEAPKDAE